MRFDVGFVCAVLVVVIKCEQIKRDSGTSLTSESDDLESLKNRISKRSSIQDFQTDEDLSSDSKRSRLNRMPAIFGKRSRLNRMPAVFGKRSRLNRMPAVFGKRSRLNRMPAVFGKRSIINRMPSYFGKRSRLNRMPAIFGKRSSVPLEDESLNEDILVGDEPDDQDISTVLKTDKISVDEMVNLLIENKFLLAPIISRLMDLDGDGYISVEELQAHKDEDTR